MPLGIEPTPPSFAAADRTRRRIVSRFEALASGDRIARAARNAAGLAISEGLRAEIGSLSQGVRNLNDGVSATSIAEGALSETSGLLVRMRELSLQAGNGTLDDGQRAIIQQEFDALGEEVSRIAASTRFNGRPLLDGSGGSIAFEDGQGGEAPPIELAASDQSAAALGVDGLDASDPSTLTALDQAIGTVARARADIGATQNRLESSIRGLRNDIENLTAAESRIRDTDFASETSLLARDQLLERFDVAVRAQANLRAGAALKLLG